VESDKIDYYVTLDAIGLYVEHRGGADLLVVELDGGFALTYVVDAVQTYVALDVDELEALRQEAAKRHRARRGRLCSHLRSLGQYLDGRQAASVIVQERSMGYSIEFTGFANDEYDTPELSRIYEQLSHKFVQKLPTRKPPLSLRSGNG